MSNENGLIVRQSADLVEFDDAKVELIRRTVAHGATNDELELYLHQARRMGLDPLAGQLVFSKFNTKDGPKVSFITSIDGYRLIADRTGRYGGSDEPVFDGEITSRELGAVSGGPRVPAKATVTVYKVIGQSFRPFSASAYWQEYYPGDKRGTMWRKMPHVMLGKVAEAAALRKAFPADLSGAYIREEMDQSEFPAVVSQVTSDVIEGELIEPEVPAHVALDSEEQIEMALRECASPTRFFEICCETIARFELHDEVRKAMKQIGYSAFPAGTKQADERVSMYETVAQFAGFLDAGLSVDDALALVDLSIFADAGDEEE